MIPIKITINFASPVATDSEHPLHLDALLAYSRTKEAKENGLPNPWTYQNDLPLAKAGENDNWVWQASRLIFTPKTPREMVSQIRKSDPTQFYRHFDQGLWGYKKEDRTPPTINTQSGQYRGYQYFVPIQWIEKAEAWCIGDLSRVKELFKHIDSIGPERSNGFGVISNLVIEENTEALEKWRLRVLPDDVTGVEGIDYATVLATPRSPYWNKLNKVLMKEPIL